jgi:alpha-galactosidase
MLHNHQLIPAVTLAASMTAAMLAPVNIQAAVVQVNTPHLSLILQADPGKAPQYLYFGSSIHAQDVAQLSLPNNGRMDAYPAYGLNPQSEAALSVRHADGNLTTSLAIQSVTTHVPKLTPPSPPSA